jgi:hypothetical protein
LQSHALLDPHPGVREQAVRLSEGFLKKPQPEAALTDQLLKMADAPEIRVRYQLALSLGEWDDPRTGQILAHLALKDGEIPAMQAAIMSSAGRQLPELVETIKGSPIRALCQQIKRSCPQFS